MDMLFFWPLTSWRPLEQSITRRAPRRLAFLKNDTSYAARNFKKTETLLEWRSFSNFKTSDIWHFWYINSHFLYKNKGKTLLRIRRSFDALKNVFHNLGQYIETMSVRVFKFITWQRWIYTHTQGLSTT